MAKEPLLKRIVDADLEVVRLVAEDAIAATMRALDLAGLVRFDEARQVYMVGKDCPRESFQRHLRQEMRR